MMNLIGYHTSPFMESWGIHLDHCTRAMVTDNVVSSTVTDDWGWWDTGIRTDMCALTRILCDSTMDLHIGIQNGGPANTTYMFNDVMDGYHHRGIVQNYGVLGQQGTPTNPTDIQWAGTFEYAHTNTNEADTANTFWVRAGASGTVYRPTPFIATSSQNQFYFEIDPSIGTASSSPYACPVDFRANGYLHRVALDSIQYSGPDSLSTERLSKLELFSAVCADSILQLDSILVAYVDSFVQTDLGRLDTMSRHITFEIPKSESGKLSGAVVLITPADSIASLWKELLIMAFDKWADDDSTTLLSGSDSTRLLNVGALCPYKFGPAVYLARTMLFSPDSAFLSLGNECESPVFYDQSERLGQEEPNEEIEGDLATAKVRSITISPNPSTGLLNARALGYETDVLNWSMTDPMGRRAATGSIQNGRIDVSTLQAGVFILNITAQTAPSVSVHSERIILLD